MNEQYIAQLETRLEKITEGLFAHIFGKRIQAHDIALQLVRALEDGLQPADDGDSRPLAPDHYTINMNPTALAQISQRYPTLPQVLSDQIIELASGAGYRLNNAPQVQLAPTPDLPANQIAIIAEHVSHLQSTTAAMEPITAPSSHPHPNNPQLIISGQAAIPLNEAIINIGRSRQNDIVLNDPHISRTHVQLRLRFGQYMIFDANSQSGTFVNNVRIREHRLQPGDVIHVGDTSLVYMEDGPAPVHQTGKLHLE